jgi:hypothetical protein
MKHEGVGGKGNKTGRVLKKSFPFSNKRKKEKGQKDKSISG